MTSLENAHHTDSKVYELTLVGPAAKDRPRNLLSLTPWSGAEWRRVVVRLEVGCENCPTWDHATVCVTAVQDLLKLHDGFLTDSVIDALKRYMTVSSCETFRGPPKR